MVSSLSKRLLRVSAIAVLVGSLTINAMEMSQDQLNKQLASAVKWDKPDEARVALQQGANPNYIDPFRQQPLLIVAMQSNVDNPNPAIIDLLLEHGANPEILMQGSTDETAFIEAIRMGDPTIVSIFLAHMDENTKQRLVSKLDLSTKEGILHYLAIYSMGDKSNVYKIAQMLIEAGADASQEDSDGFTAAAYATNRENTQLAAYLIGRESQSSQQASTSPSSIFSSIISLFTGR